MPIVGVGVGGNLVTYNVLMLIEHFLLIAHPH